MFMVMTWIAFAVWMLLSILLSAISVRNEKIALAKNDARCPMPGPSRLDKLPGELFMTAWFVSAAVFIILMVVADHNGW